jgi:hypothetical protein
MTPFTRTLSVILVSAAMTFVVQAADGANCGDVVPCACGDRLVADRTLVNGVDPITTTICPGDGLIVQASLNLGGNTIRGSGGGVGVTVSVVSGLTITGGRITGFDDGVRGEDFSGNHIIDLQLIGNIRSGISLAEANNNIIQRNIVSRMECGLVGIAIGGGSNTISLNRVEFNRFGGVDPGGIVVRSQFSEPSANTVLRNIVRQNSKCGPTPVAGLKMEDDGATVELSRSEDSGGPGFVILSVDPSDAGNTVRRNISLRNEDDGFLVFATNTRFRRNSAQYNRGFGINDDGTANIYVGNVCTGNGLGDSDPPRLCF